MKPITSEQIEKLLAILRTGKVSRHQFQRRLEEPSSILEFFKQSEEPWYQEAVAFWEKCFPGKGEELGELLAPFYRIQREWKEHKTPFPIKRGLEDSKSLRKRCREAVFWRPWKGIVIIRKRGILEEALKETFEESIGASLGNIAPNFRGYLRTALWDIWDCLGERVLKDSLGAIVRDSLGECLVDNLYATFNYACGFLLTEDEEKTERFRELLSLWAEGIILAGFDRKGRLIIFSPPAEEKAA